jgi:hypothetical protein
MHTVISTGVNHYNDCVLRRSHIFEPDYAGEIHTIIQSATFRNNSNLARHKPIRFHHKISIYVDVVVDTYAKLLT